MQAWYYQAEHRTLAYAILKGVHGERKDIPAVRTYYISEGEAEFVINGNAQKAGAGSIIEIPAHASYNFRSLGDKSVKFFVDVGIQLDLDTIPST